MSPEELAQIRANSDQVDGIVLTYEEWPENDADCQLLISLAYNVPDLIAYIDSQAAQISVLKEKLVEERAKYVHQRDREAKFGGLIHELDKGKYYDEAHQQLADEMPGVTWE